MTCRWMVYMGRCLVVVAETMRMARVEHSTSIRFAEHRPTLNGIILLHALEIELSPTVWNGSKHPFEHLIEFLAKSKYLSAP